MQESIFCLVGDGVGMSDGNRHALHFAGGNQIPLESEVLDLGDWQLQIATGINGAGEVVGSGTRADGPHGFKLVPQVQR